jgi:5-dehydro-2-deoxygluconokinase
LTERKYDLICLGRLAVDLYAQQPGARLEDASSFAKYLGGSSANAAFGAARLGLRTAMLSRVGDDHMGRFLLETLAREGCDVSNVSIDPQRLTALVLLGIKDRDTFPLIFYRENCADMAISETDIVEDFIASSRALAITGTHFSTPGVHAASSKALDYAHKHGVSTILDIDYRPVLWGLTGRGDGQTRFIADDSVSAHLQRILSRFDLVVGTEEEFLIAGGSRPAGHPPGDSDLIAALRAVRAISAATLVVKRGALGCSVIEGAIPARIDEAPTYRGNRVEVLNVLGAGDAFIAGFLYGWLRGPSPSEGPSRPSMASGAVGLLPGAPGLLPDALGLLSGEAVERSCTYANACGAIVVARHGCAPAMPSRVELDYFLANAQRLSHPDRDEDLAHLHRVSVARVQWNDLHVFTFDRREQFLELFRESGADESRLPRFVRLLIDSVAKTEYEHGLHRGVGVLIDADCGEDALYAATGRGWWVGRPFEMPSPGRFENARSMGSQLQAWPIEHVARCQVQVEPDGAAQSRLDSEKQLRIAYNAAIQNGHELLFEVIAPANADVHSTPAQRMLRSMNHIYDLRIRPDWWQLAPLAAPDWAMVDALIAERDPYCRGVLLGLDASFDEIAASFAAAVQSRRCRGFAIGRDIFVEPARAWLRNEIDDATLVARASGAFAEIARLWHKVRNGVTPAPDTGVAA